MVFSPHKFKQFQAVNVWGRHEGVLSSKAAPCAASASPSTSLLHAVSLILMSEI